MRRVGPALLVLAVCIAGTGCAEEGVEQNNVMPLTGASEPPVAGFDVDADEAWVTPGTLTGYAFDADQSQAFLPISVESVIDGVLFEGNPGGDGRWSWTGELTQGPNPLNITVEDREGNVTTASVRVQVRTNEQPTCRITQPYDGQEIKVFTDTTFSARVDDADGDPLHVLWRSSIEGGMADGPTFVRRLREVGVHTISIEVRDELGEPCVDEIDVIAVR